MNDKFYKSKMYRIALNILYCILGSVFVFFLTLYLSHNNILTIVITGLFTLIYIYFVIIDNIITVIISGNKMIYVKGRKTKEYLIDECNFSYHTVTSGADTECTIIVENKDMEIEKIDCEMIGYRDFCNLLEDLNVIGDKASTRKMNVKKKEVK